MSDSNYNLLKALLDDIMARLDELEGKLDALTEKASRVDDRRGS
jgi:hypothetical protein